MQRYLFSGLREIRHCDPEQSEGEAISIFRREIASVLLRLRLAVPRNDTRIKPLRDPWSLAAVSDS